jgi:hypothetical protein
MMVNPLLSLVPMLFLLVWLGLIVYGVLLATRLVNAVEQIARSLAERPPERPVQ